MAEPPEKKAVEGLKMELSDGDYKKLDSLFRFYGSEITSHSNYLIALAFASTVYIYQALSRWLLTQQLIWGLYDDFLVIIAILLVLLGLFLLGRLFYYTHLSNIIQIFMGVTYSNKVQLKVYQDFLRAELVYSNSFGYKISNVLFFRIWRKLLKEDKIDEFRYYEKPFDEITKIDDLGWLERNLIAVSNSLHWGYRLCFTGN